MAEKKIFDLIKNESCLEGWICLHSLGLSRHLYKVEGEIDFILVGPEGLFCLEIKGGRVKRNAGRWYFTDRYGLVTEKKESPFKQVSSALYSLRTMVNEEFVNSFKDHLFGYGVLFPDIDFNVESPEWDNQIVYDRSDRLKPFRSYLSRLIIYWRGKQQDKRGLTPSEIDQLVTHLRKDFEFITPLSDRLESMEQQVNQLTKEQFKALDRMESNKRIFYRGTAGTGKTLLALEKVRREVLKNKKVLLLCYNKVLAGKFRYETNQMENSHLITAMSLHKYFYHVVMKSGFRDEFLRAQNMFNEEYLYNKIYPEFFIRALNEVSEVFDYLVVDEGQDLLRSEYFNALDYVLDGGLERGNWVVFYDSNNQGDLYKNFDPSLVRCLKDLGAAEYWLDINCRNTKQIAVQTSVVSGFNVENTLIEGGEKVHYHWFDNEKEQIEILSDVIKELLTKGMQPGDITLIYPERDFEKMIPYIRSSVDFVKVSYDNAGNLPKNKISYSTAQGFKGMENKVIIYCGVIGMEGDTVNTLNYVSMSRARQLLYVLLNGELKSTYHRKSIEYLTKGRG